MSGIEEATVFPFSQTSHGCFPSRHSNAMSNAAHHSCNCRLEHCSHNPSKALSTLPPLLMPTYMSSSCCSADPSPVFANGLPVHLAGSYNCHVAANSRYSGSFYGDAGQPVGHTTALSGCAGRNFYSNEDAHVLTPPGTNYGPISGPFAMTTGSSFPVTENTNGLTGLSDCAAAMSARDLPWACQSHKSTRDNRQCVMTKPPFSSVVSQKSSYHSCDEYESAVQHSAIPQTDYYYNYPNDHNCYPPPFMQTPQNQPQSEFSYCSATHPSYYTTHQLQLARAQSYSSAQEASSSTGRPILSASLKSHQRSFDDPHWDQYSYEQQQQYPKSRHFTQPPLAVPESRQSSYHFTCGPDHLYTSQQHYLQNVPGSRNVAPLYSLESGELSPSNHTRERAFAKAIPTTFYAYPIDDHFASRSVSSTPKACSVMSSRFDCNKRRSNCVSHDIYESKRQKTVKTLVPSAPHHQQQLIQSHHSGTLTASAAAVPSLEQASAPVLVTASPLLLVSSPAHGSHYYISTPEYTGKLSRQQATVSSNESFMSNADTETFCNGSISPRSVIKLEPTRQLTAMLKKESRYLVSQDWTSSLLRSELVDLVLKTCRARHYQGETAYISMNLLDRYVSHTKVNMRKQGRLLALSCVYIAAKMAEETMEPFTGDMVHDEVYAFQRKDIKRMERKISTALEWNFAIITPHVIMHEFFNSLGTPDVRCSNFHHTSAVTRAMRYNNYPSTSHRRSPPTVATRDRVFALLDTTLEHIATSSSLSTAYTSTAPSVIVATVLTCICSLKLVHPTQITLEDIASVFGTSCNLPSRLLSKCKTILTATA
ncbi:G1/S-specific cyclin-D3 [Batrachochytrium dendrobatidis]